MRLDTDLLLRKIRKARVAVIGDVCVDWYLFIDPAASEISVETGLATRPVRRSRFSPGGAGNVAANLHSLGTGTVGLFGVIGEDSFGRELISILEQLSIDHSGLVKQRANWHTATYTKLYEDEVESPRIDFGCYNALDERARTELLDKLETALPDYDIVIVNQQLRSGIHTESFREDLASLIERHPEIPFIADSRDYPEAYSGSMRKLNDREAALSCGEKDTGYEADRRHAAALFERWEKPVFLSRGRYGCMIADEGHIDEIPGIYLEGGKDIVGAGDALLAGISSGLAAGSDAAEAVTFGNFAAAVTVGKRFQTGTATGEEVAELSREPNYLFRPHIAMDEARARHYEETEIEIVTGVPERSFSYAIFDHDGTISTLRRGWETVMEPVMLEAIVGNARNSISHDELESVRERIRDFIDRTTGIQTLEQMTGLVDMVKEHGYVPEEEILDAFGYKKIYNDALMRMVGKRREKVSRGELCVADVTMKNAVPFLELLADNGVVLYLASGTDEQDCREEAELLGYARLFGGGIFGATGSIEDEPKKRVLKTILEKIGTAEGVITFGDGPVEIRETVRRGGYTVGIASNETQRFGLDQAKRRRLVLAGADTIIPDFSQLSVITAYLGFAGAKR